MNRVLLGMGVGWAMTLFALPWAQAGDEALEFHLGRVRTPENAQLRNVDTEIPLLGVAVSGYHQGMGPLRFTLAVSLDAISFDNQTSISPGFGGLVDDRMDLTRTSLSAGLDWSYPRNAAVQFVVGGGLSWNRLHLRLGGSLFGIPGYYVDERANSLDPFAQLGVNVCARLGGCVRLLWRQTSVEASFAQAGLGDLKVSEGAILLAIVRPF